MQIEQQLLPTLNAVVEKHIKECYDILSSENISLVEKSECLVAALGKCSFDLGRISGKLTLPQFQEEELSDA